MEQPNVRAEPTPNVDVWMLNDDLSRLTLGAFPSGYRMRFYRPGDLVTWLHIQATDPFFAPTAETFAASVPGNDAYLGTRVMFLLDPTGVAIGTITAWNTDRLTGTDIGQIHWVALLPAARGRGLAKPMLSAACAVLREQGHQAACLETNTQRIPALNLYLQFGFVPYARSKTEREAWEAVAPQLKYGL